MNGRSELHHFIDRVRRRWLWARRCEAYARAAAAAAVVLAVAAAADTIAHPSGAVLVLLVATAVFAAIASAIVAFWPNRRPPDETRVARFVEEQRPDLEDRVASAIACLSAPRESRFAEPLVADAAARVRAIDVDDLITRTSLRRAIAAGVAALAIVAGAAAVFAPAAARAGRAAWFVAFPPEISLEVLPGDARVLAGQPLRVVARVRGEAAALAAVRDDDPILRIEDRETTMRPAGDRFELVVPVTGSFTYQVRTRRTASPAYRVTALFAPRVGRIDVDYTYPSYTGLAPRSEQDGGDIYAPAGTRVRLRVHADKPISSGAMTLVDGRRVALRVTGDRVLEATFRVDEDASYRVALADTDGLTSDGETEYFIRTMDDRSPDVRIMRPAGDRQVTPLEEVAIEARADDDYGIDRFELVFAVRGGEEQAVPLGPGRPVTTATGSHLLYVEDLKVAPGDFITYYARARDVSRGKRASEARSDIFFLEVRPFEQEFMAAQSQAMGSGGGSFEDLVGAQKEIIIATWKLERRSDAGRSEQDIRVVAKAQGDLRTRVQQAAQAGGSGFTRRLPRPAGGDARAEGNPLAAAADAMGRAQASLDSLDTRAAVPHEMEALSQLLKAQADVRRRQVARQQAGAGGGSNRQTQDLSALFDRELQRQQQTNYETPTSVEEREQGSDDEALSRVRELARRQDDLARRQRDLARQRAGMSEEELKRQLERLTREQSELRRQAEELARQLAGKPDGQPSGEQQSGEQQSGEQQSGEQQGGQQQAGQQQAGQQPGGNEQRGQQSGGQQADGEQTAGSASGSGGRDEQGRRMRDAIEEMRSAAADLRRQDVDNAGTRSGRALERLRDVERQLRGAQPDERRRALGELQLEARQIAEEQKRLATESAAIEKTGADAARRLAGEQQRLADRADAFERGVEGLAAGSAGDQRLQDASRELDRAALGRRMREAASGLRRAGEGQTGEQARADAARRAIDQEQTLTRNVDRVAETLGAMGAGDPESAKLSEQLARARELRDRLSDTERKLDALGREAGNSGPEGAEVARLRAEYESQLRQAQELLRQLGDDTLQLGREAGGAGGTPEHHEYSRSAPGTEAFKQDFAKWDVLRREVDLALERLEASASERLRDIEARDRLSAGGDDRAPEEYRKLVAKYYQSLAARKRQ
jgi:hypothetical protein